MEEETIKNPESVDEIESEVSLEEGSNCNNKNNEKEKEEKKNDKKDKEKKDIKGRDKGGKFLEGNTIGVGRPTKYKEEFCELADKYIESRKDKVFNYHKTKGDKTNSYQRMIDVKIPTIGGFSQYLGVSIDTLNEWGKKHDGFSDALSRIKTEQKERLISKGLSGGYSPIITRLILSTNHGMSEKKLVEHSGGFSLTQLNDKSKDVDDKENKEDGEFSLRELDK